MPEVNQTPIEPAERLELNVYQCGHSGQITVAFEKDDGAGRTLSYRVTGPKSMRVGKRVVQCELTRQDRRQLRRWLGLDTGSDQ